MTEKPFYHELTDDERALLQGTNGSLLSLQYKSPPWCGFPAPLEVQHGCWPLLDGEIRCEADCGGADDDEVCIWKREKIHE